MPQEEAGRDKPWSALERAPAPSLKGYRVEVSSGQFEVYRGLQRRDEVKG